MNIQSLPPKMTQQYAERARRGDYEYKLATDIFIWFSGNQEITLIGLDCPTGHVKKHTTAGTRSAKEQLAEYKNNST